MIFSQYIDCLFYHVDQKWTKTGRDNASSSGPPQKIDHITVLSSQKTLHYY